MMNRWNRKISTIVYHIILIGLTLSIVIQVYVSLEKVDLKPTGTSVEFKKFKSDISMSLTACKIDAELTETDGQVRPLISIVNRHNTFEIVRDYDAIMNTSEVRTFYWLNNDLIHICNTIPLDYADEIRIIQAYGRTSFDKNMQIFIHETGLFGSGYETKIHNDWYNGNTIILLGLEQFANLPDPRKCNQDYLYDQCIQSYLSDEINSKTNCSLTMDR